MKETILKRLLHISVFLFSATVTFAEENVDITMKSATGLELHEDVVQNVPLRINELMQSNVDCIMDDLNEFPDSWVELYNSGTSPVSLSNYKLGLTAQADEGWQLPSQIIVEPGSFIVVYCDKVGSGLHTDFRLDPGKGSSVYLFFNGEVTDKVEDLKKQPAPNISYGRQSETAGEWGYLFSVGIPSLISAKKNKGWFAEIDEIGPIAGRVEVSKHQTKWFEMDANRRSYEYFKERGNNWEYKTYPYAIDRIIRFYQQQNNQKYNIIWL